eukprot:3651278-Rhodomonas_salina.1
MVTALMLSLFLPLPTAPAASPTFQFSSPLRSSVSLPSTQPMRLRGGSSGVLAEFVLRTREILEKGGGEMDSRAFSRQVTSAS